jgi:hypothetical protein
MIADPLAVPETNAISALLAEVTGNAAPRRKVVSAPLPETDGAATIKGRRSARQLLEQANWRNEDNAVEVGPPLGGMKYAGTRSARSVGPLPAPFGILSVSALFDLINWRNRSDEAHPLPLIRPLPSPGAEFTVEAVMSTFGWE